MKRALVLLLLALPGFAAAPHRRASAPTAFPNCSIVKGSPAVTFSRDGGRTTANREQAINGTGYTNGLAALDALTLLSFHQSTLSITTDAGCTWRAIGDATFDFPPQFAAAGRDALIWGDNRNQLARYRANAITTLKPPTDIVGLAVDRSVTTRVRIGGTDGSLWESNNLGDSWTSIGGRAPSAIAFYRVAFDPANLDHLLLGSLANGAFVSFDGGRNYTSASGLGSGFNVFNIVVSPADPNSVWAMAIRLSDSTKHIYLSRDGGRSFTSVIDDGNGVTLINGPLMVPHPTDPNVLYFVFGTYFQQYGTDLFRYDAASKQLTLMHHAFDDIDAIVFSPADPNILYFGLEHVSQVVP